MNSHTVALTVICLLLGACANAEPQENPTSTTSPTNYVTPEPSSTNTPRPTATVYKPTIISLKSPTQTPIPTPFVRPTAAPIAEPVFPISADENFEDDLLAQGYTIFSISSIEGPGSNQYQAYFFLDTSFLAKTSPHPYRESGDTPGCWVAVYRSIGQVSQFLASFPAAQYPEESWYSGFPMSCKPVDWDDPFAFGGYSGSGPDELAHVDAHSTWLDMNRNGLPEFSVVYYYCPNACMDYGAMSISLYEIQSESSVVEITANLPGIIEPIKGFIHSTDPLDFYIYDASLEYCYKICNIETFWIYAWDGTAFSDVTANYANEYRERGQEILAGIETIMENGYFPEWHFLTILFHYEKAGLRDEGYKIFMEITDPVKWPDLEDEQICWLQFARASVSEDHAFGQAYRLPEFRLSSFLDTTTQLQDLLPKMDALKYDLTACEAVLASP